MEKSLLYEYFWFGTCVRYLQDAEESYEVGGTNAVIFNLNRFLELLPRIGLTVTARTDAVAKLTDFANELSKIEIDRNVKLSAEQANTLRMLMTRARDTLEAELIEQSVFLVTPKRVDVKKLLENVSDLFPPNVYSLVPEIAQYDFSEAGRCIAFERPTAAAFHMLRGTEAMLRHFYSALIRRKRVDPLLWGPMVSDLRKRSRTKKYATLYNNLDNIRTSYRNPTQHPDAIYDIHEVQDLWGLCTEVVSRMTRILPTT